MNSHNRTRRVFRWLLPGFALLAAACLAEMAPESRRAAPPPASQPTQYRGDFARRGWDGGEGPSRLDKLWEFAPDYACFLGSPAVRGGRVYCAGTVFDINGTFGTVYCLDAATGREIWQVQQIPPGLRQGKPELPVPFKGIYSSPVITADGRHLLIGSGAEHDDNCRLVCLNTDDGSVCWALPVPNNHVLGSPAICGELAVVGAGAIERNDHNPIDHVGYVMCVRISDGIELWRRQVVDPEASPAVSPDGKVVYVGSGLKLEDQEGTGCVIVALAIDAPAGPASGPAQPRELWRLPTPHAACSGVTLAEGMAIIGCGTGFYGFTDLAPGGAVTAVDADGKLRWQAELPDGVWGVVAVADGRVICPVRDGTVRALSLKDGSELWHCEVSPDKEPVQAPCAVSADRVYALSVDGYLAVIDVRNGQLLERQQVNAPDQPSDKRCVGGPTLAGGRLYVPTETGGLRCYGRAAQSSPASAP